MDDQKDTLEDNVQRMVNAGMGGAALTDSTLRKELLIRLKRELPNKPASDFPSTALGLIAAVISFMACWWMVQSSNLPIWQTKVIGILIGVNLLFIPIGSFVIVNRRRHV
jgi:hypothetical protein